MKQNSKSLTYFTIRETISCFLKKGLSTFIEEGDISTFVLQEMFSNNLAESMDKLNLDYNVLYTIFDVLDSLGFVSRKSDSTCT